MTWNENRFLAQARLRLQRKMTQAAEAVHNLYPHMTISIVSDQIKIWGRASRRTSETLVQLMRGYFNR